MPSAKKTPNYKLNQWEGNEYPKRIDFVEDNMKIDQALTTLSVKIAEGSTITDPQTKSKYKWGIENGLVYLQEVE